MGFRALRQHSHARISIGCRIELSFGSEYQRILVPQDDLTRFNSGGYQGVAVRAEAS
jgi:hypothetical protein